MNLLYKKITLVDIDEIVELFDAYRVFYKQKSDKNAAKKFLTERIKNNESKIFVAQDSQTKKFLGFVQLYPTFSSISIQRAWILNDLFVCNTARKKGVGEFLVEETKKFVEKEKSAWVHLCTQQENLSAQALYNKTGFIEDPFKYYIFSCNK